MREPARKLKRSAVKNIVRVSAAKSESGRPILVESILEKKYTLHLDFDANVVRYQPQPKTFELTFDDGSMHTYTPDFEVLFLDGSTSYVEVKPAKYAADLYFSELFRHMKTKVALPTKIYTVLRVIKKQFSSNLTSTVDLTFHPSDQCPRLSQIK